MTKGNWQVPGGTAPQVRSGSPWLRHGGSGSPCGLSCWPSPPPGRWPWQEPWPAGWVAAEFTKAGKPAGQLGQSPEWCWSWQPLVPSHRCPRPTGGSSPRARVKNKIPASWEEATEPLASELLEMCNSDHTPHSLKFLFRRSGISDFPGRSLAPTPLWKVTGINVLRVSPSMSTGSKKLQDHHHRPPHSAAVPTASWVHFRGCF